MSEGVNCKSCQGDFEGNLKIPMLLPCNHNICVICAYDQFQRTQILKCGIETCQQTHQMHPVNLKKDEQLLKQIKQSVIHQNISLLKSHQFEVKRAQTQLTDLQTNTFQQLIQHLNNYVFKDNIALQRELNIAAKAIQQQLNYLNLQQYQLDKKQGIQQDYQQQQNLNLIQIQQTVQHLLVQTQKIVQQHPKISTQVYEEMAKMKANLNEVVLTKERSRQQVDQQNQQLENIKQEKQRQENQIYNKSQEFYQLQNECQRNKIWETQYFQEMQIKKQNESQFYKIIIVSPNNRTIGIMTKQNATVGSIKNTIQEATELFWNTLDILKDENKLEDEETLSYYGIKNNENLYMKWSEIQIQH